MRIKPTAQLVAIALEKMPETRDNDSLLIAAIWKYTLLQSDLDPNSITASEFLRTFARTTVLPNTESIRRSRQKIQEQHPELRGQRYKARQGEEETETRNEIRSWDAK